MLLLRKIGLVSISRQEAIKGTTSCKKYHDNNKTLADDTY
jgi:hypothetical protein